MPILNAARGLAARRPGLAITLVAPLLAAPLLAAPAALAQGARPAIAPAPGPNPGPEVTNPLSADSFGFTQGSDVADVGKPGLSLEYDFTSGARSGRFRDNLLFGQVSFGVYKGTGLVKGVELTPTLLIDRAYDRDPTRPALLGLGTSRSNTSAGGGFEAKFKLSDLDTNGYGLTFDLQPSYVRTTGAALGALGGSATRFGFGARVYADAILLPNRLFAAANLAYDGAWSRVGEGGGEGLGFARASVLTAAASVTTLVAPRTYLGAEVRALTAFDGALFERRVGRALFVGPTFLYGFTENLTVAGAYNYQIAGSSRGSDQSLDLADFGRHVAKLKVGYSF